MAKRRFINFAAPDELLEKIDESAELAGVNRSKQARALIEYALGIERKPYIPREQQQERLRFKTPTQGTPSRRRRNG